MIQRQSQWCEAHNLPSRCEGCSAMMVNRSVEKRRGAGAASSSLGLSGLSIFVILVLSACVVVHNFLPSYPARQTTASVICPSPKEPLPSSTATTTTFRAAEAATSTLPSYDLARTQSFGFFDDVTDENWKLYQQRARTEPIYSDPHPDAKKTHSALWLLKNVDPIFTCPQLRRVGGRGDGPKWTCDPHRLQRQKDCLVYSVGSKGVYLFEDGLFDLLGKHCSIHVFDPDPKYGRDNDPMTKNIHYHPWGLKAKDEKDPALTNLKFKGLTFYSLPEIMDKLNHTGRPIDVFKIDCEGCEKTSFVDWLSESIDIRQILIETHFGLSYNVTRFFDSFLDRGFVPFSKEANTHPGAKPVGELFEFAFVRLHKDFLGRGVTRTAMH